MKFFIDSGNLKEIESLVAARHHRRRDDEPVADGEGGRRPARTSSRRSARLVQGPVSAEVVATDAAGMIAEGRELAKIDEHVVVKVPFTRDGVKACKTLASEGIRVNVTLIFSPTQALFAAKVGAAYVSPFVGRLDDIASDGMGLIAADRRDLRPLRVHDRSARRERALADAHRRGGAHGRDVCTCPPAVIEACFKHPLTDIGLEKFLKDWEKAQAARA